MHRCGAVRTKDGTGWDWNLGPTLMPRSALQGRGWAGEERATWAFVTGRSILPRFKFIAITYGQKSHINSLQLSAEKV